MLYSILKLNEKDDYPHKILDVKLLGEKKVGDSIIKIRQSVYIGEKQ